MAPETAEISRFLGTLHPYDALEPERLGALCADVAAIEAHAGAVLYSAGSPLDGLYIVAEGQVDVRDGNGQTVSLLGPGNSFGERGLMRDGVAVTTARTVTPCRLYRIPPGIFRGLVSSVPAVARFFDRTRPPEARQDGDITGMAVADLMSRSLLTCTPDTPVAEAARMLRAQNVSCLLVADDSGLRGILTNSDLTHRVLAEDRPGSTPVAEIMTADPVALGPEAIGSDVLHQMLERNIGHLPVVEGGRPVGIVTQTDLTRLQAISSGLLIREIARARDADGIAAVVRRIPELLAQLVGTGRTHWVTTRLVTDIADAATRRLLALAEAQLGPAPMAFCWAACGSQGRQEQTGVSDQDNCLILARRPLTEESAYFEALARFVCDGLNTAGYVYCPGEMMATTPRWRQPVEVWREYFTGWIARPDPKAQMLASVMFDLRVIGGDASLLAGLVEETLSRAAANSIFVAHMVSNSLGHAPPLGLLRGLATLRSGEHRDTIDMKMNGVVPVIDLCRCYALIGKLPAVNSRARLLGAIEAGVVSGSGGRDLADAFDVIAETRLNHQADRVRRGLKPDNFMPPATLSDLERSHLRDAFVVVKSMQSALGHGRGAIR